MEINVKLFGDLREGRFKAQTTQIEENSRVIDLIQQHNLPEEEVSICFVNNRPADFQDVLQNGDTVAFSRPVGGM